MSILFLAWQDPLSRIWFPIGRLSHELNRYQFNYIKGVENAVKHSNFQPLTSFPDLQKTYQSKQLFPLFMNRVMRPSRPDYQDYLRWLNLQSDEHDPIEILARSGGTKVTDHLEVFPYPRRDDDGSYQMSFFLRGLRYCPKSSRERVNDLEPNENLYLMWDLQNEFDSTALALRTKDKYFIGYCPRYLAPDVHQLLELDPRKVEVKVELLNPAPTPIQLRLRCRITAPWPQNFRPFSGDEYGPIKKKVEVSL